MLNLASALFATPSPAAAPPVPLSAPAAPAAGERFDQALQRAQQAPTPASGPARAATPAKTDAPAPSNAAAPSSAHAPATEPTSGRDPAEGSAASDAEPGATSASGTAAAQTARGRPDGDPAETAAGTGDTDDTAAPGALPGRAAHGAAATAAHALTALQGARQAGMPQAPSNRMDTDRASAQASTLGDDLAATETQAGAAAEDPAADDPAAAVDPSAVALMTAPLTPAVDPLQPTPSAATAAVNAGVGRGSRSADPAAAQAGSEAPATRGPAAEGLTSEVSSPHPAPRGPGKGSPAPTDTAAIAAAAAADAARPSAAAAASASGSGTEPKARFADLLSQATGPAATASGEPPTALRSAQALGDAVAGLAAAPTTPMSATDAASTTATAPSRHLTSADLDAPVGSPGFGSAIGTRIAMLARDGIDQARLQVSPAELGPIALQLALDGTQLRVDMVADAAATRQALEQSLPALASSLRDAGFTLAGGGVFQQWTQGGQQQGSGSGAGARPGSTRADDSATAERTVTGPTVRRVRDQGLVDLYA